MELILTENQRADLAEIHSRAAHPYERDARDPADRGDAAQGRRKKDQRALAALRKAWDRLQPQTQEDVIAHLLKSWNEFDDKQLLPDIGRTADLLAATMKRPDDHREEDHPGLGAAAEYLWDLWVCERRGVDVPESVEVPFDDPARRAIAPFLADEFGLPVVEVERRLKNILPNRNRAKRRTGPVAGRHRQPKP